LPKKKAGQLSPSRCFHERRVAAGYRFWNWRLHIALMLNSYFKRFILVSDW
jgi:hypothetical protein